LGKVGSILSTKKDEKLWARIFTPWKTCVYFSSEFESCKRISKGYRYKVLNDGPCRKNECSFLGEELI